MANHPTIVREADAVRVEFVCECEGCGRRRRHSIRVGHDTIRQVTQQVIVSVPGLPAGTRTIRRGD